MVARYAMPNDSKVRGEQHHNAKLTETQAREILARRPPPGKKKSEPESAITVAAEYHVRPTTVRDIWHRRTWKHI